eukprot:scaffold6880_cov110-Isochrysis_galbana.AAC.5
MPPRRARVVAKDSCHYPLIIYAQNIFADLALALAHARRAHKTTHRHDHQQRGTPPIPPSLNTYQARLSPLATLDEEAELLFSNTLHDHLTEYEYEYDLAQYTVNRPQQNPITHNSNRTHPPRTHRMEPRSGTNQLKKNTGAIAPWGHSGNP